MNTRSKSRRQNRSFIKKLPTEMHLEIFQYLDSWSIRRVSETCMTFFNVTLRHEFKEHFKLNMFDMYLAPGCGIGEVFKAKNRTVRKYTCVHIGKVDIKTMAFAKNFFMRIGKEISELHIRTLFFYPLMMVKETEKIESNLRKEILKNFPNLKKLVVEDNNILENLSYYPPFLKEIFAKEVLVNHRMFEIDYADILPNQKGATGLETLVMSKTIYPCICTLNRPNKIQHFSNEVHQIINEIADLEHFQSIETDCNILNHKNVDPAAVKGITFGYIQQISFKAFAKFPNLESIDLSLVLPPLTNCFTDHSQQMPDLKHIKNLSVKMGSGSTCNQCISGILTSFTGLKKLEIRGDFTDTQARLIFTSMPDLEELILMGSITSTLFNSAEHHPNSIENLKKLKSLKIANDCFNNFSRGLNNKSLLDFASLPQLEIICLQNHSTFSLDGIQSLANKCPHISTFYSSSLAVNSSMVEAMVRSWPQLRTLVLDNPSPLNTETWDVMKENCRFLRNVAFSTVQPTLTFLEECSLFEKISSLKTIKSGSTYSSLRTFTRTEYYEQDTFLERYHETYTSGQLKRKRRSSQGANKRRRLSYAPQFMNLFGIHVTGVDLYESDDMESDDEEQNDWFDACVLA